MSSYLLWQSYFLVTSSSSFVPIDQHFFERPSAAALLCLWPRSPISGFSERAHQTRPLFAFGLGAFTTIPSYNVQQMLPRTGWTHRLINTGSCSVKHCDLHLNWPHRETNIWLLQYLLLWIGVNHSLFLGIWIWSLGSFVLITVSKVCSFMLNFVIREILLKLHVTREFC